MKYPTPYESFQSGRWGNIAAGVLPVCPSTGRMLVALRSSMVNEAHTWGIFGGKLEEGEYESIQIAALRELEEESGFSDQIHLVKAYVYREPYFQYHNFFGIIAEEFTPLLNWESDNASWYTLDELLELKRKHFGLVALLHESMDVLKKILQR